MEQIRASANPYAMVNFNPLPRTPVDGIPPSSPYAGLTDPTPHRFDVAVAPDPGFTLNDLRLHAVIMAGQPGVDDGHRSAVYAQDYDRRPVQGSVHLIGGIIEEYYGAFGTFDPRTGAQRSGYSRDFRYDRRMERGFSPPYFPTTTLYEVREGSGLTGLRPVWRELRP